MMHKKRYSGIFLVIVLIFILESNIIVKDSSATSYYPNIFNYQGYQVIIEPNDYTSINFNLIGSKVEILSNVQVNLTTFFHDFVFSRHISIVVNHSEPINLAIDWYFNLEVIKDLLLEEIPNQPTLKEILLLFNYNCYFRITSNSTIDSLTLKFDKISTLGLDPSKQYTLASFVPGDSEWSFIPTEDNYIESTSEKYIESKLTDVNDTNSYYFTIFEKAPELSRPPINWLFIMSITITIGCILIALITVISKQDYIQYLKNRNAGEKKNRHRLSLDEVLENENRSRILEIILKKPGIHFNELLRESEISSGTLVWHLDVLLIYKIIGKKRLENFLIYFPYYLENTLSNIDLKLQKSEMTLKLLKLIEKNPGISNSEIAKGLNINRKTVQYHLEKLILLDLITKKKTGRKNQLYLKSTKSSIK